MSDGPDVVEQGSDIVTPRGRAAGDLRIPWRRAGLAGVVFGIASAASLVVVASIREADVLATVALTLAVLAFVVQIIVFLVQSSTSSQQMLRGEALYSDTKGLLREVQATAAATQAMLIGQFDTVLRHALRDLPEGAKGTESSEAAPDLATVREAVESELQQRFQEAHERISNQDRPRRTRQRERSETRERQFPDREEGEEALKILDLLSPLALNMLRRYADDLVSSSMTETMPGLYWKEGPSPFREELLKAGLIEESEPPEPDDERKYGVLTDLGRTAARMLTARGNPPRYVIEWSQRRK